MLLWAARALADDAPAAPTWAPLRVALDCQTEVRIDLCTLVRGNLDGEKVIAVVPLSEAAVVLHLNASAEGNTDFVQLRAVRDPDRGPTGAPDRFEQPIAIDYRLPVDTQRAQLGPAIARALAPYVSATNPAAVEVKFNVPKGEVKATRTTPWGCELWAGGYGHWSQDFKSLDAWGGASLYRKTNTDMAEAWVNYSRSISLQPSLEVGGEDVALTSDSSDIVGAMTAAHNLSPHWSLGGNVRGGHDDPQGQYLGTVRAGVGVEYDQFPSDDPRGNRLGVALLLGGQADWYNQTNTIGQTEAFFPTETLVGSGSIRFDKVTLSLGLSASAQLWPFLERYVLDASLDTDLTLGDHVDLSINLDATQQAIPGPADIDASSYEAVTRASYAQPLQVDGSFNITVHWDNTNSARNNRFKGVTNLDVTAGL